MSETTPVSETPTSKSHSKPNSKKGILIFGALGCLWISAIFILGAVAVGIYIYTESTDDDYDYNYNYNSNYDYNYNDNYEYNANHDYNYNYNYNANTDNTNTSPNANVNNANSTGEKIDPDGTSLGFKIEDGFVKDNLYAYQVGAFATGDALANNEWPAFRFTVDFPENIPPMTSENDNGSLWVGSVLDNGYFVQVGMMSSTTAQADGTMAWNYFWEMWDDQDVYQYGLQDDLSSYMAAGTDPEFTLTCQDPSTGEWQFWVNDETVGKTYTGDCSTSLANSYIFWEFTTDKTDKATLPTFGPFTVKNFEYWDGYTWTPVEQTTASYSYGRIVDGTVRDQASVCPPFGIEGLPAEKAVRFGSTVACAPMDTPLW